MDLFGGLQRHALGRGKPERRRPLEQETCRRLANGPEQAERANDANARHDRRNRSDIGDEAVFMAPGVLYVRKGDVFITINLYYVDNALDKTKALAEKVFARL